MVIDHQFYDPVDPDQDHTLIVASNVVDNKYVFPKKFNPVLYQGIGHVSACRHLSPAIVPPNSLHRW